jgi:hypothetical protein
MRQRACTAVLALVTLTRYAASSLITTGRSAANKCEGSATWKACTEEPPTNVLFTF